MYSPSQQQQLEGTTIRLGLCPPSVVVETGLPSKWGLAGSFATDGESRGVAWGGGNILDTELAPSRVHEYFQKY